MGNSVSFLEPLYVKVKLKSWAPTTTDATLRIELSTLLKEAYQNRLYSPCQTSSKMDYANDRYWQIEWILEKHRNQKYFKTFYKGKLTKRALRMERLYEEQQHWDQERWKPKSFPKSLREKISAFDS